MIRFIIVLIAVIFFLIVSLPIQLILWLIRFVSPSVCDTVSRAIVGWAFRVCIWLSGVKLTVIGEENVPKDRPVLYISNHRSFYDIILTYCRVPRATGYISKKSVKRVPSLSTWMMLMNCLFLDRDDIKQGMEVIKKAIDHINNGISIYVCPEGTRNKTDEPILDFHAGTFKIAERTGCTIIPITMVNSEQIFEAHLPKIKSAHVILEYGKPIETKDMSRAERKQVPGMTHDIIKETYLKNLSLV